MRGGGGALALRLVKALRAWGGVLRSLAVTSAGTSSYGPLLVVMDGCNPYPVASHSEKHLCRSASASSPQVVWPAHPDIWEGGLRDQGSNSSVITCSAAKAISEARPARPLFSVGKSVAGPYGVQALLKYVSSNPGKRGRRWAARALMHTQLGRSGDHARHGSRRRRVWGWVEKLRRPGGAFCLFFTPYPTAPLRPLLLPGAYNSFLIIIDCTRDDTMEGRGLPWRCVPYE